jgi:hypothetical protein
MLILPDGMPTVWVWFLLSKNELRKAIGEFSALRRKLNALPSPLTLAAQLAPACDL